MGSFISHSTYFAGGNNLKDTKINGAIMHQLFGISMWVLLAVLKFTGFCKHNQVFFFPRYCSYAAIVCNSTSLIYHLLLVHTQGAVDLLGLLQKDLPRWPSMSHLCSCAGPELTTMQVFYWIIVSKWICSHFPFCLVVYRWFSSCRTKVMEKQAEAQSEK